MDAIAHLLATTVGGPIHVDRPLRFHCALGQHVLVAESLDGVESPAPGVRAEAGFGLTLTAQSFDGPLDLAEPPGQPALLRLPANGARTKRRLVNAHTATP